MAAAVLAACSGGNTAGSQQGVTVTEIQKPAYFYEGDYLGEVVTVSAAVAEVRSERLFELSGGAGDSTLTVMTRQPVDLQRNQVVQVTGTVGQLHRSSSNRVPYIQEPLYSKANTESYLYDAVVRLAPG